MQALEFENKTWIEFITPAVVTIPTDEEEARNEGERGGESTSSETNNK